MSEELKNRHLELFEKIENSFKNNMFIKIYMGFMLPHHREGQPIEMNEVEGAEVENVFKDFDYEAIQSFFIYIFIYIFFNNNNNNKKQIRVKGLLRIAGKHS